MNNNQLWQSGDMSNYWVSRFLGYAVGLGISVSLFQVGPLFFLPLVALFIGCFAMSQAIAQLVFPVKWIKDRVGSETGVEMETYFSRLNKWFYGEVIMAVALTLVHFQVLFTIGVIGKP